MGHLLDQLSPKTIGGIFGYFIIIPEGNYLLLPIAAYKAAVTSVKLCIEHRKKIHYKIH